MKPRKPIPRKNERRLERTRAATAKRKRERAAKRHEQNYGPPGYADHVRAHGCAVEDAWCWQHIEAAHVRSKGAGGKWRANLVGLCRYHHGRLHEWGWRTFEKHYGSNLKADAYRLYQAWESEAA